MSTLIAIGYPSAETAEEVRGVLVQATKEKLVDLQDAVVVEHAPTGRSSCTRRSARPARARPAARCGAA